MFAIMRDLDLLPADFSFTSMQILFDAEITAHRDRNPMDSIIFATGSYGLHPGGDLVIDGTPFSVFRKPLRFDGSREHFVSDYSGARASFVLYPHHASDFMPASLFNELQALGFRPRVHPTPRHSGRSQELDSAPRQAGAFLLFELDVAAGVAATCLGERAAVHFACSPDPINLSVIRKAFARVKAMAPDDLAAEPFYEDVYRRRALQPLLVAQISDGTDLATFAATLATLQEISDHQPMVLAFTAPLRAPYGPQFLSAVDRILHACHFWIDMRRFGCLAGFMYVWMPTDVSWPDGVTLEGNEIMPHLRHAADATLSAGLLKGHRLIREFATMRADIQEWASTPCVMSADKSARQPFPSELEAILQTQPEISNGIPRDHKMALTVRNKLRTTYLSNVAPVPAVRFLLSCIGT